MSTRIIRRGESNDPPLEGEWLRISAEVTSVMTPICGREDVLAQVRPARKDASGRSLDPAPASFHIPTAMITVDGNYLRDEKGHDVDPSRVHPKRYSNRLMYPALWGAVTHEGAHAAFTQWPQDLPEGKLPDHIKPHWIDAAILMEEPRIEHHQIQERGGDRRWLRACTKQIVMDEGGAPTDKGSLAKMFILIRGRVIAGVLDEDEAEDLYSISLTAFGEETVTEMDQILTEVMDVRHDDMEAMIDLGRRWVELLGEENDGTSGESIIIIMGMSGDGDGEGSGGGGSGEGENSGSGGGKGGSSSDSEGSEIPSEVMDALNKAAESIAKNDGGGTGDPDGDAARQAEAIAAAEAAKAAMVFHNHKSVGHGFGTATGGTIRGYRSPSNEERGGAALLAQALRRAVIRERSAMVQTSQRPPGRLRMRDGVSFQASKAAGQIPVAKPFSRKVRKHNPSPPLRVGFAQDVSGSQSAFVRPAALAGWTVARAVSLIPEAQFAMVTFGSSVKPVVWPKQEPPGVAELLASDGHEMPSTAVRALDGILNLTQPGYARLLFMATDGEFVHDLEAQNAVADIARLLKSGCRVIWLATGTGYSGGHRQRSLTQSGVHKIDVSGHPENIGEIIANAVVEVLKE